MEQMHYLNFPDAGFSCISSRMMNSPSVSAWIPFILGMLAGPVAHAADPVLTRLELGRSACVVTAADYVDAPFSAGGALQVGARSMDEYALSSLMGTQLRFVNPDGTSFYDWLYIGYLTLDSSREGRTYDFSVQGDGADGELLEGRLRLEVVAELEPSNETARVKIRFERNDLQKGQRRWFEADCELRD